MNIGLTRADQGSSQTLAGPLRGHLALHLEMSTIVKVKNLMHFSPGEHLRHSCYVSHESYEFS